MGVVRSKQMPCLTAFATLAFLLLLSCGGFPQIAKAWSGFDAYTIVVLNDFDTDVALQEQFYNAPTGTPFSLSRTGYRVLDAGAADRPTVGHRGGNESLHSAYPLDPALSTGAAFDDLKASDAPLPFRGRFSGEWVVWTKENVAHPFGTAVAAEPLLLHCRLPLSRNRTEVQLQQRRYIAQHAAALSEALEVWWHAAPAAYASRCLYGDGEKTLTGTERYYELCPGGPVTRVQHHRLTALLLGSGGDLVRDTKKRGRRKGGTALSVLAFLHQMHQSTSNRNAVLRNPRYRGVFEEIGHYHPRHSKPRWNSEHLVWESWYPSTQRCTTHYTAVSSSRKAQPFDAAGNASQRRQHSKIHPEDPYWKTVVRFRCPSQPNADATQQVTTWTVTEARQLCEYHVELMSVLVCGWEQELDSFNVNPVPCVVLD
ncbi:hypothetical protein N2W54_007570 [Lotmaria passim]